MCYAPAFIPRWCRVGIWDRFSDCFLQLHYLSVRFEWSTFVLKQTVASICGVILIMEKYYVRYLY